MRVIEEKIDGIRFLEFILTNEEVERINKRGICKEFVNTEFGKFYVSVLIRNENLTDINKLISDENDKE